MCVCVCVCVCLCVPVFYARVSCKNAAKFNCFNATVAKALACANGPDVLSPRKRL